MSPCTTSAIIACNAVLCPQGHCCSQLSRHRLGVPVATCRKLCRGGTAQTWLGTWLEQLRHGQNEHPVGTNCLSARMSWQNIIIVDAIEVLQFAVQSATGHCTCRGTVNIREAERWREPSGQLANLVMRDLICCDRQFVTRLTRCSGANS